jgi:predicted nucleotidyltransferase
MGTFTVTDSVGRLLFGSVRREVLALLLGRPDERFYVREIVRSAGGGSGAVQRELKQLTAAGLVIRVERGNHTYFHANREAPIFADLRAIMEKTAGTADILRSALSPLTASGRIKLSFVYGSVASGKQTARSDIDLFVVGDATLAEIVPLVRVVSAKLGRDINPSVYRSDEFRDKLLAGAPFIRRVLAGPKLFVTGSERELARLAE